MDSQILIKISRIIAAALDSNDFDNIAASINAAIPDDMPRAKRAEALKTAVVYSLVCEQPGYPPDGKPGYLPCDANLKEAVLNEIDAMISADFDQSEHRETWKNIRKSVEAAPDAEFTAGVAVNCPDDYLLMLDRVDCAGILRQRNLLPAWAEPYESNN